MTRAAMPGTHRRHCYVADEARARWDEAAEQFSLRALAASTAACIANLARAIASAFS